MDGLGRALEAISRKADDLFITTIGDLEIVFRLPPVRTAQQYTYLLDACENDGERNSIFESIFRETVEDDWITKSTGGGLIPAGVPETIARLVLLLSGCNSNTNAYTSELFKNYRKQVDSTLCYMQRVVCSAFSGYTFEILEKLNYQKLVYIFIQAEKLLLEQGIITVEHNFEKPVEVKAKQFLVEDAIKSDTKAYSEFSKPAADDPKRMAMQQAIREKAIQRAKEEERKFKQRMRG